MKFFTVASIQALVDKYAQEGSKVFDAEAYKAKYLNDPNDPLFSKPLEHFLTKGAALGYNPLGNFPLKFFDADFYGKKYEELGKVGVNDPGDKFGHYLLFGMGEGRQASQDTNNFNSEVYLKMYPGVEAYVKAHLSDFNMSLSNGALAHFVKFGALQGFIGPIDDLINDAISPYVYIDDTYSFDYLLSVKNKLMFLDNPNDRDALQVTDAAVNFNNIGADTISLENLNNSFEFDFDVLDMTKVNKAGLTVLGDNSATRDTKNDDLLLGKLSSISAIGGFKKLYLTDASIADSGNSYTLDTANGNLLKNNSILFSTDTKGMSAATGIDASLVKQDVALKITGDVGSTLGGSLQNDTLTGGSGADSLEGRMGRDVLNGGPSTSETYTYKISGDLGPKADAVYSITIDGNTKTLTETENADPNKSSQVEAGATADVVGAALVKLINAHLSNLPGEFNENTGNGVVQGAKYDATTNELVITYAPGVNVPANNLKIEQSQPDDLNKLQVSLPVNVNGSKGGGDDTFIFHTKDSTLVEATADVIENFVSGSDTLQLFNADDLAKFVGKDAGNGMNYVESGFKTASFATALIAANLALTTLNNSANASTGSLVSFQFDDTNGYLFQDVDGDGKADQVIILTGIDNTEISHADLG
ncbi:MAG: hypothetical protein K1X48_04885 [Burkholderiaceae bacterium]|nr:hypothetical protein [Burkholderiaceae bacterium]